MPFLATEAPAATETLVANDGFFPDVDPADLRDTQRLDGTVTAQRLQAEVVAAVIAINSQLDAWRSERVAEGFATLDAIDAIAGKPVAKIGGKSALVQLYTRAVYCTAHAVLIERYRNFDATATARKDDDVARPGAEELRRDALWAVNDILGKRRTTVELI